MHTQVLTPPTPQLEERGSDLILRIGGKVVFERKDHFLLDKRQREKMKKREKISESPRLEIRSS